MWWISSLHQHNIYTTMTKRERRGSRGFLTSSPIRRHTESLESGRLEEETPAVSVYSFDGTPSTGTPSIATPSFATPSETPSDEELEVDVLFLAQPWKFAKPPTSAPETSFEWIHATSCLTKNAPFTLDPDSTM